MSNPSYTPGNHPFDAILAKAERNFWKLVVGRFGVIAVSFSSAVFIFDVLLSKTMGPLSSTLALLLLVGLLFIGAMTMTLILQLDRDTEASASEIFAALETHAPASVATQQVKAVLHVQGNRLLQSQLNAYVSAARDEDMQEKEQLTRQIIEEKATQVNQQ